MVQIVQAIRTVRIASVVQIHENIQDVKKLLVRILNSVAASANASVYAQTVALVELLDEYSRSELENCLAVQMNSTITKLAAVVFFVVGFEVEIAHLLASWALVHELATPRAAERFWRPRGKTTK